MLRISRLIHADAPMLWELLIDTHAWPSWGPSVQAVDCPTRFVCAQSVGRVRTAAGFWVPFRIVEWDEGAYWSWRVAGVPATGHRVQPISATRSEVIFSVPNWAPFYVPVCSAALRRIERLVMARSAST
jgi:hypothetical protein